MKTVKDIFAVRAVEGDIGVEIEVEGKRLPRPERYWNMEADHSLKGESMEYVLNRPRTKQGVKAALNYLEDQYKFNKTVVDDSVRAGVHIHINVQELNIVQLYNFMTLYLMFEEPLVKFCGEYREGNLFCLRASDAGFLTEVLKYAIRNKKFMAFRSDDLRYASMNVKALATYGSLEFRAMRGTRDLNLIYKWAEILLNLRDKAKTFEDPEDVITGFSGAGVLNFAREIFGPNLDVITSNTNYEELVFNGMRNAQDIAYAVNWDEVKNPVVKNPFKTLDDFNGNPEEFQIQFDQEVAMPRVGVRKIPRIAAKFGADGGE